MGVFERYIRRLPDSIIGEFMEKEPIPVIIVDEAFVALAKSMDFDQMTEDEFLQWLIEQSTGTTTVYIP